MNGLLVRVGADCTDDSRWNGPVDVKTGGFVYVPIAETKPLRPGLVKRYDELLSLTSFGVELPRHLTGKRMHLDPDFEQLTYGDQGERAKQVQRLREGDLLAFYASMRDVISGRLVYALIGMFIIDELVAATDIPKARWNENAHTRRIPGATDLVVRAKRRESGRLSRCIPIGEYRDRAYRVTDTLLNKWGGLSVKNGYLQRSARLPAFIEAPRFYRWLKEMGRPLLQRNN